MKDFKTPPGSKGRKPALTARLTPRKGKRPPLPKGFQPLPAPRAAPRSTEASGREARRVPWLAGLKGRRVPVARLLTGAALVWLALGAVAGGRALWQAPLSRVTLEGGHALSAEAVVALAGLDAQTPLAGLDPYTLSQRIAAHPRVRKADVRRVFPGELIVTLEERQPSLRARTADGTVLLLDRERVVLGRLEAPGKPDAAEASTALPVMEPGEAPLPTVTGVTGAAEANRVLDDPALRRGLKVLERLRREEVADMGRVVVEAEHAFLMRVRLPDGPTLVVSEDRTAPALATYRRLKASHPELLEGRGLIDLSTLTPDGGGRVFLRQH